MEEHTVTQVSDFTKDWSFTPKNSTTPVTLTTHYVQVENLDGVIEINKKLGAGAPKVGEILTGSFTETDYVDKAGNTHYKFKAAQKFGSGGVDLTPVLDSLKGLHAKLDRLLGENSELPFD